MSKKLKTKVAKVRGKKDCNTISPPHIETRSLGMISDDGSVTLTAAVVGDGAGLWISDAKDPNNGVAVYKVQGQMAVGVRVRNEGLAAALSADPVTGEGLLQLATTDGVVVLTGTEIVAAIRNMAKMLSFCTAKPAEKAPRKARVKKAAAPKATKPRGRPKKIVPSTEPVAAE